MPWTEDPDDKQAKSLRKSRHAMVATLRAAEARLRATGWQLGADRGRVAAVTEELSSILSFFGADGRTTADALDIARDIGKSINYCSPSDRAITLPGVPAKFYVLGPPRDEKKLKKHEPTKSRPETYEFAAMNAYIDFVLPALASDAPDAPFASPFRPQIPLTVARGLPFFERRYWGRNGEDDGPLDQRWRRIDTDWLEASANLALKLDNATNNTSLAIAIELTESKDVLLFAADAQVGSWLSWQDLVWKVDGGKMTAPDLLARTIFYKVGHHGSHNATLREKGLEQMKALQFAFIPVVEQLAKNKKWGEMPLPSI
jgi:hypothetical protein